MLKANGTMGISVFSGIHEVSIGDSPVITDKQERQQKINVRHIIPRDLFLNLMRNVGLLMHWLPSRLTCCLASLMVMGTREINNWFCVARAVIDSTV